MPKQDTTAPSDTSFRENAEAGVLPPVNDAASPEGLYCQPTTGAIVSNEARVKLGQELNSAEIGAAVNAGIAQLTEQYDLNRDGMFAGKELRTMFGELVDEVAKVEPGVEQYLARLLAVSDRMGSMPATQVAALLRDGMNAADTNHDGIISAPELRAVRQEIANPVKTR